MSDSRPLTRFLPFLAWLPSYRRRDLTGDCTAGLVVAVMLVPQGMAYALLAGLPPETGLYASVLPLIAYALFGTSRAMSVGPMAIVSLMVASGLSPLAAPGSETYLRLALVLALLVGLIKLAMGLLRLGFLGDLLSYAVVSGYTSAAALIILADQGRHLLGIEPTRQESFYATLFVLFQHLPQTNLLTAGIGMSCIALLLVCKGPLKRLLLAHRVPAGVAAPLTQGAPLLLSAASALLVWSLGLEHEGVAVVGALPQGLPPLALPPLDLDTVRTLFPLAITVSLVSFTGSIAVAKSLASRRRQRVDANQEWIGLGVANIGTALAGGVAVTGGLSRSLVNFSAGANTGLASLITAAGVAVAALFFTPFFYYLPVAALAAIVAVAAAGILDLRSAADMWRYNRADAASLAATFAAVLVLGVEQGIATGVTVSLLLFLWRTGTPHVVELGRVGDSELFGAAGNEKVKTYPHILLLRVDESLYFANANRLEGQLLNQVAERPEVDHLILVCHAVNYIDASALETLERLRQELAEADVQLHLAEAKPAVAASLERSGLSAKLAAGCIFASAHEAVDAYNRPQRASYHI